MKGFVTIAVVGVVVLVTLIMLNFGISSNESISYKETFSANKIMLSNYEILLLKVIQDCNWELETSQIKSCVDGNSNAILNKMEFNLTTCNAEEYAIIKDTNTANGKIICHTEIKTNSGTEMRTDFNKNIILKKYD